MEFWVNVMNIAASAATILMAGVAIWGIISWKYHAHYNNYYAKRIELKQKLINVEFDIGNELEWWNVWYGKLKKHHNADNAIENIDIILKKPDLYFAKLKDDLMHCVKLALTIFENPKDMFDLFLKTFEKAGYFSEIFRIAIFELELLKDDIRTKKIDPSNKDQYTRRLNSLAYQIFYQKNKEPDIELIKLLTELRGYLN